MNEQMDEQVGKFMYLLLQRSLMLLANYLLLTCIIF